MWESASVHLWRICIERMRPTVDVNLSSEHCEGVKTRLVLTSCVSDHARGSSHVGSRQHCSRVCCRLHFVFSLLSVTLGHGQEPQMDSRGQYPGRRVEDHFARASSTLCPLGETPKSVSRCQPHQERCEGQGFSPDTQSRCAKSCAHTDATSSSVSSRGPRGSSRQDLVQAAISALEDADVVEKENLAKALQRAQAQAVVSEQIISTQGFMNRERKRLAAAEEALIAAVKNRDERLEALAQGEKRLQELQSQEKSPFSGPVADAEAELVRLRAQVAEIQGRAEMSVVSVIPADAMPGFPAEPWMEDRQKDLQEALSTGDHSRVVKLSLMLTKGAERMVEMTRQDISDDEFRSRAAPGEGRFAPY